MKLLRFTLAALLAAGPAFADDLLPPSTAVHDAVDHSVAAALNDQKATPAPLADDATTLRRITLDLAGRIPTAAELTNYLASNEPDKKAKLVDRLLAAGSFQRHQVNEL